MGSSPAGGLEHQRGQAFKGQMGMLNLGNLVGQQENAPGIPSISWGDVLSSSRSSLGLSTGGTAFVEPNTADQHAHDYGDCPSSSSFKVFSSKCEFPLHFFKKLILTRNWKAGTITIAWHVSFHPKCAIGQFLYLP